MKEAGDVQGRGEPVDEPGQRIQKALEIIHATRQRLELEAQSWEAPEAHTLLNELEAVLDQVRDKNS